MPAPPRLIPRSRLATCCVLLWAACAGPTELAPETRIMDAGQPLAPVEPIGFGHLLPKPVSVTLGAGVFVLGADVHISVDDEPGARAVAMYLAERLRPATGFALPVTTETDGAIVLTTRNADPALGNEGYTLQVTPAQVRLSAKTAAGLFAAVQTLHQLFPPSIEAQSVQAGPWTLAAGSVRDFPRFAYRGVMLDVARHFFPVSEVERLLDLLARYKLNHLHLHLSDDQGFRLAMRSWPKLTELGASSAVGGDPGGFYTQDDYRRLVAHAASRHIVIVPEIDLPGHTGAALASYAELNCDDVAKPLYTGTEVGKTSLCIGKPITAQFVSDVLGELATLTPGPYLHVGGDEAHATSAEDYASFMATVQDIVARTGKRLIGWEEIASVPLLPGSIAQLWATARAEKAVEQGARVIMSPAKHAYLDMKYDESTELGQAWAGYVDERRAYDWDPASYAPGITERDVFGVEAPLWTEFIRTRAELDFMMFPRLLGHAEIGWSPAAGRSYTDYEARLVKHAARLERLGVNFRRSPHIPFR